MSIQLEKKALLTIVSLRNMAKFARNNLHKTIMLSAANLIEHFLKSRN